LNRTIPFLPYARQTVDDDDIAAVAAVLRSDFLTTGPVTLAFEEKLVEVTGAQHAVSCSSGTAGLHLAALALGLGPGDGIIVPSITFLATANAARFVDAEVVFADVDPDTGLMGPEHLNDALDRADGPVKAVFPVHLAGQSPDMIALARIADARGIAMVEDACHALGSTYQSGGGDVAVGRCADSAMAAFSFHPIKTVTMGEGGAVTTNDDALLERLRRARNHGMVHAASAFQNREMALADDGEANSWYYEMHDIGFNYRASDIHCALGLSQLGKLDAFTRRRRMLADRYDMLLVSLAPVVRPVAARPENHPVHHLYVVLVDFERAGISRDRVMRALRDRGIGTQVHYIPVHRQPYYRERYGDLKLPGADAYYAHCLALPFFTAMTDADAEHVVQALAEVVG
jgi:UDP-4-amino-4,6-dideoxy-N-acetyl-beta-L-altrosamine transaminase